MKNIEIGIATINYKEDGSIDSSHFRSTMVLSEENLSALNSQLLTVSTSKDVEKIQYNAEMVLASWFNQVGQIETSNKHQYEVTSENLECEKYPSGTVKMCTMKFTFKEKQSQLN